MGLQLAQNPFVWRHNMLTCICFHWISLDRISTYSVLTDPVQLSHNSACSLALVLKNVVTSMGIPFFPPVDWWFQYFCWELSSLFFNSFLADRWIAAAWKISCSSLKNPYFLSLPLHHLCYLERITPQRHFLLPAIKIFYKEIFKDALPITLPSCLSSLILVTQAHWVLPWVPIFS